jgi:hypothetical protein
MLLMMVVTTQLLENVTVVASTSTSSWARVLHIRICVARRRRPLGPDDESEWRVSAVHH